MINLLHSEPTRKPETPLLQKPLLPMLPLPLKLPKRLNTKQRKLPLQHSKLPTPLSMLLLMQLLRRLLMLLRKNSKEKLRSSSEICNSKKKKRREQMHSQSEETKRRNSKSYLELLERKENTSMLYFRPMKRRLCSSTWFGIHFQKLKMDGKREMDSTYSSTESTMNKKNYSFNTIRLRPISLISTSNCSWNHKNGMLKMRLLSMKIKPEPRHKRLTMILNWQN